MSLCDVIHFIFISGRIQIVLANMKQNRTFNFIRKLEQDNVKRIHKQIERTVGLQAVNMTKQRRLHKKD